MWYRIILPIGLLLIFFSIIPVSAQDIQLPEGKGKEEVKNICSLCHGLSIVISQRLNKQEWTDIVERMIRWGAPIGEEQKILIVDYLSINFGYKDKR